ncbi:MAG: V-type ATP synthase subunit I [Haloferacaceae archaeon]
MLRPERMSKVSVTGSKRVMDDVVEATHDLNLLHLTEYDGTWEEFAPGDPTEEADDASDKLVTIRSIESILDVDDADAGPTRVIGDEELTEELVDVRDRVNDLDDRRNELRDDLRAVEEELEAMEPFTRLGIDLDLLAGYDSLEVAVGEGDAAAVERTLADADAFDAVEVFEGEGGVLAAFAHPTGEAPEDALSDALVGVEFAALDVPDSEDSPGDHVARLEQRRRELDSKLTTVEDRLAEVKAEAAGFLLAAEEELSIEVQKAEAPLSFATTANAFVAEGWLPTERYEAFERRVTEAVDGRVDVEELERAQFKANTHEAVREEVPGDAGGGGGAATAADGGVVMADDDPPVVQRNPSPVRPFELLTRAVGLPKYTEFDPTVVVFLTLPLFFGIMIGDFGYGLVYALGGYVLYANVENEALKSMGGVAIASGLLTMFFGFLYGEIFGLHLITSVVWEGAFGMHGPVLEKGLMPAASEWAKAWLFISVLLGIVHLNVGFAFDFLENLDVHDAKHALFESGSWLLMLNGLWAWIFSTHLESAKPEFLFTVFGTGQEAAFHLGFAGLPAGVGIVGLLVFAGGLVLLVAGEPVEAIEFLNVLVNALSYTRLAAEVLAEVGIAFVVNLLFFGAYQESGEFHLMLTTGPAAVEHGEIMFPGLIHMGAVGVVGGLVLLIVGHLLVLVLGVLSAGMQAIRLEYVEFFGKFYEGGGKEYDPLGYVRQYTADE